MLKKKKPVGPSRDYSQPPEVTDAQIAFGAPELLPPMEEIPEEFKHSGGTKWNRLFRLLFFNSEKVVHQTIEDRKGVDPMKAGRAIRAIMVSWAPKHQHKEAGCAYLMSLWFSDWDESQQNKKEAS